MDWESTLEIVPAPPSEPGGRARFRIRDKVLGWFRSTFPLSSDQAWIGDLPDDPAWAPVKAHIASWATKGEAEQELRRIAAFGVREAA